MKMRIMFISLSISGMSCLLQATYAQPVSERDMDKNSILLRTDELSGVVVQKTTERPWIIGIAPSGKPPSSHGVLQEVEAEGVKARIHYAEFDSDDAARQAADFHINNVAMIFQRGLWDGAKNESIGDESWYARGAANLAVLVRSGRTCILIGVHNGDFRVQARIAENLAERLVQKVKHGARVPVSGKFRK